MYSAQQLITSIVRTSIRRSTGEEEASSAARRDKHSSTHFARSDTFTTMSVDSRNLYSFTREARASSHTEATSDSMAKYHKTSKPTKLSSNRTPSSSLPRNVLSVEKDVLTVSHRGYVRGSVVIVWRFRKMADDICEQV